MSNELAVATVTATLGEWVRPRLEAEVQGAVVSMLRPDEVSALETPGVNIFLYQVAPNPAYRNADLATRRGDGSVLQRPQAALDLHYLLTFYGSESDLEPQRVLGSVVRTLHARPLLSRQAIEDTIASASFSYLVESDLAEQFERVRVTPIGLSLDELSKLWSVFFQTPYRLSVAYLASLVLIEEEVTGRSALPVRTRNVYARPFRPPVVENLLAAVAPEHVITSASTLIIEGRELRGEVTRVQIGEAEYVPAVADIQDRRITLDLATAVPASGTLRAGLQAVQVVHRLLMGTPPAEHEGIESNVAALLLRPRIVVASGVVDIDVSPLQADPDGNTFRAVTVRVAPPVGRRQRVQLLLDEYNVDVQPRAFSYAAEPRVADTDLVVFNVAGTITGEFLFRVQVDGAQSPLERNTAVAETDPLYNRFHQPRRTIP